MKISIFGLGYVGAVTAACLSEKGHEVIGVDLHAEKIEAFQNGKSPIVEPQLDDLISKARYTGNLNAHNDCERAIFDSSVSFICVGTPSLESGRLDLKYVRRVCEQIAIALNKKQTNHLLIIRSTMLPGSTRFVVDSFLQEIMDSGKLIVVYCPEFLREGSAVRDFQNPSLSVAGSESGESIEGVEALVGGKVEWLTWEGAELLKYTCNFWHALKVDFANEIGRVCKHLALDAKVIMKTVCKDTELNISDYYMKPGNPFGGSCLPKDVSALAAYTRQEGISLPLLENALSSNQAHLDYLLRLILNTKKQRVAILGLAFKSNTDDLRGSPMVALSETLISRGFQVLIYDINLNMKSLMGSNQTQISRRIPDLIDHLTNDVEDCVSHSDIVVVAHSNIPFEKLHNSVSSNHHVIDINGWDRLKELPCSYEGLCW
jgi:GDP-mannose 6-dehydrogenase